MNARDPIDLRHAGDALWAIDPGCTRDEWLRICFAAIAAGLTIEEIVLWSSQAANYGGERDVRAALRGIKPGGLIGVGTLWRAALATGWRPPKDGNQRPAPTPRVAPPQAQETPRTLKTLGAIGGARFRRDNRPLSADCIPGHYLRQRGCVMPPADGDVRWNPARFHGPSRTTGPALVSLATDPITGEPLTEHSTWVQADGNKAPLTPPRMVLGGYRQAGGVIRVWPDEAVTMGLAIAEGVESALSMAHAYTPVWACINAGNMASFPVLPGIESLVIAADNDPAGIRAAEACARRWTLAGREVCIVMAEAHKADINDVLRAAA